MNYPVRCGVDHKYLEAKLFLPSMHENEKIARLLENFRPETKKKRSFEKSSNSFRYSTAA